MKNQKVDTKLGVAIIVIFAITAVSLMWIYENGKSEQTQQSQMVNNVQQKNQGVQNSFEGEEFPTVTMQPGVSLEGIIRQAIFKKFPEWKVKNYSVTTTVEKNNGSHAFGEFAYDNNQSNKYHNAAKGIWFAAGLNDIWTLTSISYAGYNGICQNFKKYNFPADMTPDCWDDEKNVLVDTPNPALFYKDGFIKTDKKELVQAFISYIKNDPTHSTYYLNNNLYVRINKSAKGYFNGTMLVGGSKNISAPYFLAVRKNGNWKVVFNGQDIPNCDIIEPFNFPSKIINKCYDEQNKQAKTIL
ncbi:MAG: hypothetical protein Q7T51_01125 [Candidatus Moranbacteria bacterium]|nr:hypothetical protein [Candidatus Moranbacteria bacterium]